MTREPAVQRDDIERYRQAIMALGGEASLKQVIEHAGTGEADRNYIAACLIVPAPSTRSERGMPFALPSLWGRDGEGWRLWRTEPHWTDDDIRYGMQFLGMLKSGERE